MVGAEWRVPAKTVGTLDGITLVNMAGAWQYATCRVTGQLVGHDDPLAMGKVALACITEAVVEEKLKFGEQQDHSYRRFAGPVVVGSAQLV